MEKFSKNGVKPKRGRPPGYHGLMIEHGIRSDRGASRRSAVNHADLITALNALSDKKGLGFEAPFQWLGSVKPGMLLRRTILYELGRLGDRELIRHVAADICKTKPSARVAASAIRRFRLNQNGEGDLNSLIKMLAATIDRYAARYPKMHWTTKVQALRELAEAIQEQHENLPIEETVLPTPDEDDRKAAVC